MTTIGVDLGGSKIAAGLVDERGSMLARVAADTAASKGPSAVLATLLDLVAALQVAGERGGASVDALGLATTGVVDVEHGRIVAATEALPGFAGRPIRASLEEKSGLPVVLVNDVQAFALGDQRFGLGAGHREVLYLVVGTGVGGAMTVAGRLVAGAHGFAGDLGHVLVDCSPTARRCPCGMPGHLEAYVSGPALVADYERRRGQVVPEHDLREVVALAELGDADARASLAEGGACLGRAVGGIVNLLDPELIVLGGGVSEVPDELLWSPMREAMQNETRHPSPPSVERSSLRHDAAIVGAAVAATEPMSVFH